MAVGVDEPGHATSRHDPGDGGSADRWLLGGLCLLAAALSAIATRHGPGLLIDSVNYLTTGINLAHGHGLRMLADRPLTAFPPGLPLLAALGEAIGIGAENMLRLVSVLSSAAIVLLGHRLVARIVSDRGVVIATTVLLAASPVLLSLTTMAITEPPFIVVSLALLLVLGHACDGGTVSLRDVTALAALVSTAFLFRYIALALIPVGVVVMLLSLRPLDRRSLWRISQFALASAVVPIACMLRNHAADGTYLGHRVPTQDSVADVARRAAVTVGEWIYPVDGLATTTARRIGVVGIALVLAAAVLLLPRGRHRLTRQARTHLLCCAVFVPVYLVFLVFGALRTQVVLSTRLLGPVFVPALVIVVACLAAGFDRLPRPGWRGGAAVALFGLVALYGLAAVADTSDMAHDGIGYNQPAFTDSSVARETLRLVRSTPGAVVYSNDPFALWAGTGMRPIFRAPRRARLRGAQVTGELEALQWRVACAWPTTYLSVAHRSRQPAMSVKELRGALDVTRVAVADDGAVFRLESRSKPDCSVPPTCTLEGTPARCEGDR